MFQKYLFLSFIAVSMLACSSTNDKSSLETSFLETLNKHINAVQAGDIEALKATLPSEGKLFWVKPNGQRVEELADFVDPHKEWFSSAEIYMDYEILHWEAGPQFGHAGVIMYYYHEEAKATPPDHIQVSYVLKRSEGSWKVIADHATFVSQE